MKKLILILALIIGSGLTVWAGDVPITGVPSGYARYCSVANFGGWKLELQTQINFNSDPCATALSSLPFSTIQRAGLWSMFGGNNVLRWCKESVQAYQGNGQAPINEALKSSAGLTKCVFVIAPKVLKIFSKPYLNNVNPTLTNPFDYDTYDQLSPTEFGQPSGNCPPEAGSMIDRTGKRLCYGNGHNAHDWVMPSGTPLYAVAKGIVRVSRWRDVSMFGGYCAQKNPQAEIYVEHQVGDGVYAEKFFTYYAHGSTLNVQPGQVVEKGQLVGLSGDSGCSTTAHLHFGVNRTTNLSGYYSINFGFSDTGYGITRIEGAIDPFGWVAPQGVDPRAWRFLGNHPDPYVGTVSNPGAFSIYLWEDGQAPPTIN
ncbi:MAG: M23 family metallopeptidase [Pyrinomonadaceae bacterium]|nr:M23 family metallopeptidase [Pyrinomonadaceae bacterium]